MLQNVQATQLPRLVFNTPKCKVVTKLVECLLDRKYQFNFEFHIL